MISKKALSEPHSCEACADLVCRLQQWFPELNSANTGRPLSLKTVLLNVCQEEFESTMRATFEFQDTSNTDFRWHQWTTRALVSMRFVGQLFVKELLTVRIIVSTCNSLVTCGDGVSLPREFFLECICELLNIVGRVMDSTQEGYAFMEGACNHLAHLSS